MVKSTNGKIVKYIMEGFMILIAIAFLSPIWFIIVTSLKTQESAAKLSMNLPDGIHLENFLTVFRESNALKGLINGLLVSVSATIITVIIASMAAFYVSRARTKLAGMVYGFFVSGIVIPMAVVPTFFLLSTLHLKGTFAGLILVFISMLIPFSVFLYSGFIKTIPRELDEAAFVDGCGVLRSFFQIILPLLQPITVTVVVFCFIWVWNDVINQLYLVGSSKWGMPMTVYTFFGRYTQKWNLVFADIVITILPCILLYILGQKYIIAGMTSGAIKG